MIQITRSERRRLRAHFEQVATLFAASCYDIGPQGRLVRIEHPKAVAALKRAFTRMLQEGCEPQVLRISDEAARGFPSYARDQPPGGCTSWLGVGLDVARRGTYCLRHIQMGGAFSPAEGRRVAEAYVLSGLDEACGYAGFPEEASAT